MKKINAKILSNTQIAPDYHKMVLKSAYLARNSKPGQFINVKCSSLTTPLLRKPFGLYKINKNDIEILYKVVGQGTKLLMQKKKGETLDLIGPLGNGFNLSTKRYPLSAIIIAGGHGAAPLVALAQKLAYSVERIAFSVFIGAKTKKHILCENDFKKLKAKIYVATDDGSKGRKGLITDLLKKNLSAKRYPCLAGRQALNAVIYACGPKAMLKSVAQLAAKNKISCQVLLEEYMACGIGTCMGCAVYTKFGYKLVCKDGPVFDAEEIVW